jgi:hypothetical protein
VQLARRIRGLERATRRRIDRATDAGLEAYRARHPNPALTAEITTRTDEQLEAANLGVSLATVRAMQPVSRAAPLRRFVQPD